MNINEKCPRHFWPLTIALIQLEVLCKCLHYPNAEGPSSKVWKSLNPAFLSAPEGVFCIVQTRFIVADNVDKAVNALSQFKIQKIATLWQLLSLGISLYLRRQKVLTSSERLTESGRKRWSVLRISSRFRVVLPSVMTFAVDLSRLREKHCRVYCYSLFVTLPLYLWVIGSPRFSRFSTHFKKHYYVIG